MYRQRVTERQMEGGGEWFVSRVCGELPVVNSAVEQLSALYSGVKQHNRLFRFTLDTAEGGVLIASQTAKPVFSKFDKQIGTLNAVACQQLDKLQHDYPIITKPTEELLKETRQLCTSAVQPLVNGVSSVKQYSVDKVCEVKTSASDRVYEVKQYSVSTVNAVTQVGTEQLSRALNTPLCRQTVNQLDMILNVADQYVDTLLPETETEVAEGAAAGVNEPSAAAADSDSDDDDEVKKREVTVMVKAAQLGSKLRRRMSGRLASRLRGAQLRTKETVERLHFTVDLIEYSRAMMSNTVDKATYMWTEINKSDDEVVTQQLTGDRHVPAASAAAQSHSNFERRAIATVRHLRQKSALMSSSVGVLLAPVTKMSQQMSSTVGSLVAPLTAVVEPVHELVMSSVAAPASGLMAVSSYTVCVVSQYHVLITETCSSWFGWIVTTAPLKTVSGMFVSSSSSDESRSSQQPGTELTNLSPDEHDDKGDDGDDKGDDGDDKDDDDGEGDKGEREAVLSTGECSVENAPRDAN